MKKILILSLFVAVISSCSSMSNTGKSNLITLTGKVEKLGMTTFQYGTHLLKNEGKTFALKSSSINLDNYLDKQLTLKGIKVDGYPLEGGPEFIDVKEIKTQ